jgi:hypothetical protein
MRIQKRILVKACRTLSVGSVECFRATQEIGLLSRPYTQSGPYYESLWSKTKSGIGLRLLVEFPHIELQTSQ